MIGIKALSSAWGLTMAHSTRDVAGFIPPEEVPDWVYGNQIVIYLCVMLTTMVIYDAGEVILSHHSRPS